MTLPLPAVTPKSGAKVLQKVHIKKFITGCCGWKGESFWFFNTFSALCGLYFARFPVFLQKQRYHYEKTTGYILLRCMCCGGYFVAVALSSDRHPAYAHSSGSGLRRHARRPGSGIHQTLSARGRQRDESGGRLVRPLYGGQAPRE